MPIRCAICLPHHHLVTDAIVRSERAAPVERAPVERLGPGRNRWCFAASTTPKRCLRARAPELEQRARPGFQNRTVTVISVVPRYSLIAAAEFAVRALTAA